MKLKNVLFCLLLVLLVLPVAVAAETTIDTNYIQLTEDTTADWSLSQDLYLDLNGHSITGRIDTNGYTVYGMDSTTAQYDCEDIGYFTCVDEGGEKIVPARHV